MVVGRCQMCLRVVLDGVWCRRCAAARVKFGVAQGPVTSESQLRDKAMAWLKTVERGKFIKVVGGPFQRPGTPDICGSYRGLSVWIELKVAGKEPTKLQVQEIKAWQATEALAFVCRDLTEVKAAISIADNEVEWERL